ncbi:hydroxyacylglutathione hydrolase [Thiofilum flexile]|uniref:hydroxyacylglutathione hydrolase n=1 Tax=Thiofilum flexile TaxID=125627 RepID=UPI0003619323|nr:hydroxyacylglutathione hydrolase [Thiofilum flexile]
MIEVIPVPAFTDNYIWFITDKDESSNTLSAITALTIIQQSTEKEGNSEQAMVSISHTRRPVAIVDPGDAAVVFAALEEHQLEPIAILITHRHRDHVGGIEEILQRYPHIPVYGPETEEIPHRTHALNERDMISLAPLHLELKVLDVRGHTAGHIAYYGANRLFCGDTIFANGCGRVFDSTLEELYHSLQKIAHLPSETLVYCAHEYTVDNLGFAKWVEPDNEAIDARLEACWDLIDNGKGTVPFILGYEFNTNPFLRTHIPEVIKKAESVAGRELKTPEEVFATLRIWKDTEYD